MTIDWHSRYRTIQKLTDNPDQLVTNGGVHPRWIGRTSHFWYDRRSPQGREIRLVDAATRQQRTLELGPVFTALEAELGAGIDTDHADLRNLDMLLDPLRATFEFRGHHWEYNTDDRSLRKRHEATSTSSAVSPDGKTSVRVRDHNVWIRELATDEERQLTTDGEECNAYASLPLAARSLQAMTDGGPEGLWSPDSRYFLTLQTDERQVPELPYLEFAPTTGVRPTVRTNRTSLPGDPKITEFRILAIDTVTGRQTEARYPRLPAVRMNDTVFASGRAWWGKSGRTAYFVDIERGEKAVHVVEFDISTGATRVVFSETADTPLELGVNVYAPVMIAPLPDTDELVWYSERSGRGHLYLYDLTTGSLRNPVTSGPWQVRELLGVDTERREVRLMAGGLDPAADPYLRVPCIAPLDGGRLRVLSDEEGDHTIWRPNEFGLMTLRMLTGGNPDRVSGFSPDGNFFVETVAGVDRLPRTVLRGRDGELLLHLETAQDIGLPAEWEWPEPVTLKAADGVTDVYGLLFKPWGYDPAASYPVIDYIYGGPQIAYTPKGAFADLGGTVVFLDATSFARLGAFTLVLDGRGTANRERDFRQASYGAAHTASDINDHIAGIRQLAERHPAMDLSRVGITGFSGGGYAAALAALRHGDFFKVAVAGGGNYDQALFWHSWGERYHGGYDFEHYRTQAARTYAAGLTGKLLFIHGLMDSGCHPAALFQLVQGLIDEDKDFDLVLLPTAGHELTGYGIRRRLDYFVTHLFGVTPPSGITMPSWLSEHLTAKAAANATPPATGTTEDA